MFSNQYISGVAILGSILEAKNGKSHNDPFEGFRINPIVGSCSHTEPGKSGKRLFKTGDLVNKPFVITPSIVSAQQNPMNHC